MKRTFDLLVSLSLLLIFSWLLILIGLLIKIIMGSPVVFVQDRVGLGNKVFKFFKFRTMENLKNKSYIEDKKRITKLGKFLRESSLDELLSLFNVLKGDMSLVGPRPLLTEYLPLYSKEQIKRHNIKPGITGWAQINGRNQISWEKRFELDIWYLNNHSIFVDFFILFKTIILVISKKNINQNKNDTMKKFRGSKINDR